MCDVVRYVACDDLSLRKEEDHEFFPLNSDLERLCEGSGGMGDGVKVDRVGRLSEILGRVHWGKAKIDYKAWYHPRCWHMDS